jgi:threonine synthase
MTRQLWLECAWCARETPCGGETRCQRCNGPLKVTIDISTVHAHRVGRADLPGLWRWFDLLPIADRTAIVSLHEGNTPLLRASQLAGLFGLKTLLLKDETRNPTGSFKDRMLSVGVSRALELGHSSVAVQSSGNVGAAAAAYAAKAEMSATVFVPESAPEEKTIQAQMYGARVLRIEHSSPTAIFDLLLWASAEFNWYLVSTAAIYNPFTLDGAKTIAYEIAEQTGFTLPDWIVAPVGGGGLIGSLWRGFRDLQALGRVQRLPRMVGVQAAGCAPFVDAIANDRTAREALEERWPHIDTIAGAIADDVVFDAHVALPAVRESNGTAVSVPDEAALAMEASLASTEGLFVEPAAATTLAAVQTLVSQGRIAPDDRVLCVLTGSGLKDLGAARRTITEPVRLPLDRAALASFIQSSTMRLP